MTETGRIPVPFIVGCGRSGTTLLRAILDAHREMAVPPEAQFLVPTIRARTRAEAGWSGELLAGHIRGSVRRVAKVVGAGAT